MLSLEICAATLQSAIWAGSEGADRIELCENLAVGGLTPSATLLSDVLAQANVRCHTLIRPRSGDFVYSNAETDSILSSVNEAKKLGVQGIVVGMLDRYGNLDLEKLKLVLRESSGLSITFHRAIDVAADPRELVKKLIDHGVERVLTSGGQPTSSQGTKLLSELEKLYGNHIGIMAGGGIHKANLIPLARETGIKQFHGSARKPSSHTDRLDLQFGIQGKNQVSKAEDADIQELKEMIRICRTFTF